LPTIVSTINDYSASPGPNGFGKKSFFIDTGEQCQVNAPQTREGGIGEFNLLAKAARATYAHQQLEARTTITQSRIEPWPRLEEK